MKIRLSYIPVLSLLILLSCIEPIDFSSSNTEEIVYVDGYLTDDFGYQSLRIGRLIPFTNFENPSVATANVFVETSEGDTFQFDFIENQYVSQVEFAAEEDVEYELHIVLDGVEYISSPQNLVKGQQVTNYTYREDSTQTLKYNGELETVYGITLSVDMDNSENEERFYKVSTDYTFIFEALRRQEGHPFKRCYNNSAPGNFLLHRNTQSGYSYDIGFYPFGREFEFMISYQVTQISMNEEAYDFWNEVELQSEHTGSIFDTPPYTIRGNLQPDNPVKQIRGYFGVYAIRQERIYITQHDLSYEWDSSINVEECYPPRGWPDRHCFDCTANLLSSDRSNQKPDWWP